MQELGTKISIIICSLFINFFAFSQVEPPTIMPGFAGIYSGDVDTVGVNARLYFAADHHYCFGPEVSYFKKTTEDLEKSLFEANINLHYIFELSPKFGVYPLAGINYTIEKEVETHNGQKSSHEEDGFGINAGAGFHYAAGRFLLFSEYKYVISELDGHFFTVGFLVNFPLKRSRRQKEH